MEHPPFAELDPSNRVRKRAQYEAFAFSLQAGDVRVRNESHLDPAKHEYRVAVVDGLPVSCSCPADERDDGPCKHRVAVAIRPKLLELAMAMQAVSDCGP